MADISIRKKDEVFLKVDSEPSIAQELSDHFCFEVPGAKFHPLYKSRMWDGKVRLFSMFTKELYVGLLDYVEKFAKERDYSIDYSQYVQTADAVTLDMVKDFVDELNLSLPQNGKVREYQLEAIYKACLLYTSDAADE